MSDKTKISWTTSTWNPTAGCSPVSDGCDHCLPADTRVLDAHLRPVAIGDIRVGDELLGYDELLDKGQNRCLRVATVERVWATRAQTVTFTTAAGRTHTASVDHRWLARVRPAFRSTSSLRLGTDLVALYDPPVVVDFESDDYLAGYLAGASQGDGTWCRPVPGTTYRDSQWYWRVAEPFFDETILRRLVTAVERLTGERLEVRPFDSGTAAFGEISDERIPMVKVETRRGATVNAIVDVIECRIDSDAFAAGWLAGIVDTDGCHETSNLRVAQSKDNDVLDTVKLYGARLGFDWRHETFNACPTIRLYGDSGDRIRFAVTVGGAVSRKALGAVVGMRMPRRFDSVVSVALGPVADFVDIQTSTGTFVLADGLATHNCYAERMSARLVAFGNPKYEGVLTEEGKWSGRINACDPAHLEQPFRWKRPRMIFVDSMSDLFHPEALRLVHEPTGRPFLAEVFAVMAMSYWHVFQVLTKRPHVMRVVLRSPVFRLQVNEALRSRGRCELPEGGEEWPEHIGFGVSIEDDRYRFRMRQLGESLAGLRFLSVEPMIGPVHLTADELNEHRLDWVIVGGESQTGARPMKLEWALEVAEACAEAEVPFFFKQCGSVLARELGLSNPTGADPQEWRDWPCCLPEALCRQEFPLSMSRLLVH